MPAAYVHEKIAKKALSANNEIADYIEKNKDPFLLGAQGPDILFFYKMLNPFNKSKMPNKLGEEIHQIRVYDFLKSILSISKEAGKTSLSWLLGFLCHYATDCTIHPYVYATTNNEDGSSNTTQHLLLETYFDTWLYRDEGNRRIPRQASCIKRLSTTQKKM